MIPLEESSAYNFSVKDQYHLSRKLVAVDASTPSFPKFLCYPYWSKYSLKIGNDELNIV